MRPPGMNLADTLFVQEPKDFFPGMIHNLLPHNIIIRHERQTFRRLPKSGAVIFIVKTSITPLVHFPKEELAGLAAEIRSWPEDIAEYKGRGLWQRPVLGYCEGRPTALEDIDLFSDDHYVAKKGQRNLRTELLPTIRISGRPTKTFGLIRYRSSSNMPN